MSIGLSRNARLLLAQLVQVHQRGKHQGLSGDQLSFTFSVRADRTTAAFASGDGPLETSEVYAVDMLRANGLIEEFTTINRTSDIRRYVVTQAGELLADRTTSTETPDTTMRRRTDVSTAALYPGRAPADTRASRSASPAMEAANAERTK
jgi:hypothetical protein